MLSKILFNLTAVSLFLYISTTSATPTAQTAELQMVGENIHERTVPRRPYKPHLCQFPYAWQRRECMPLVGPRAWQDVCAYSSYHTRFQTEYQNIQSACPENTWCTDRVDEDGRRFVRCVLSKPGKRKREGPQVGASGRKRARPTLDATELEFSVKLEDDMVAASVSAVVESESHY